MHDDHFGDSLDALRSFPEEARQDAGVQIHKVQNGVNPDDWKPMPTIGKGVRGIRIRDEAGAFRVMYLAKLEDAVYILHCFQKKTPATSEKDKELARKRFKELTKERRS